MRPLTMIGRVTACACSRVSLGSSSASSGSVSAA
jgi:hypothetical protein